MRVLVVIMYNGQHYSLAFFHMKMQWLALLAKKHRRIVSLIIGIATLGVGTVALAAIVSGASTTNASAHVTYTQLTLNVPTHSTGDVLIAGIAIKGGTATVMVTVPTGWTQIARTDNDTNVSLISYEKVASASEPSSFTWTIQDQTRAEGGMTAYSGVDQSTPIDVAQGNSGRGKIATTTSITASAGNEQIIALYATEVGTTTGTGYFIAPTTTAMTQKYNVSNANLGPSIAVFDAAKSSPGSTGSIGSATSDNKVRDWATQIIALRGQANVFTSSGTWTAPAGVTAVTVDMWGAGGGGDGNGQIGGGAGAYVHQTSVPVTPGNTYTITIGQGGTGGVGIAVAGSGGSGEQPGGNGSAAGADAGGGGGGSSSFSNDSAKIIAAGGAGGGWDWNSAACASGGSGASGIGGHGEGGGGGANTPGGNASGSTGGAGGTGGTTCAGTSGFGNNYGGASAAGASGNGKNSNADGNVHGGTGSGGATGGANGTTAGAGSDDAGFDSGGGGGGITSGGNAGGAGGVPAAGGGGANSGTGGTGANGKVILNW